MISIRTKGVAIKSMIVLTTILFSSTTAMAAPPYLVTDGSDEGAGTLRDALGSGATEIVIDSNVVLDKISSTLAYTGKKALEIVGSGQTVKGGDFTLLAITMGADLTISNLNFAGPGDYDVDHQGGGKGIFVDVPLTRKGIVNLTLTDVTVSGVGKHGVHVSDCDLAVCGAGGGGGGDGSPASISAMLFGVMIDDVGNGDFDADGLRIDDRGHGDIVLVAVDSTFKNVGADGVELDEGDEGNVTVVVFDSDFLSNGGYCAGISDIPDVEVVSPGTADDRCLEWDEDEYVLDLDDGFDIDEAGDGNIRVTMHSIVVDLNLDEGLDFDEEGKGNVTVKLTVVVADENGDETIKIDEAGRGDIKAKLKNVSVTNGGDDGIQMESADAGKLHAKMRDVTATGNKKYGVNLISGSGKGWLKLKGENDFDSNQGKIALDGVELK